MKGKILLIITLLAAFSSVYGANEVSTNEVPIKNIYFQAVYPFDITENSLIEIVSYENITLYGGFSSIFSFRPESREFIANNITKTFINCSPGVPINFGEKTPLQFTLDSSCFYSRDDKPELSERYDFELYPDMLIVGYYLSSENINETISEDIYWDYIWHFDAVANRMDNDFLKKVGISPLRGGYRYKLIVYCTGCWTDAGNIHMDYYKKLFNANIYGKPYFSDFILYGTNSSTLRRKDYTIVTDSPDPYLYLIELTDVVIPYSTKEVDDLESDLENTADNLDEIWRDIRSSESVDSIEKTIDSLQDEESRYATYF
ncbi:MAG: hypothetical protein ACE5J5_04820 [Candidatus Hydrothermarchaeales archaeon]